MDLPKFTFYDNDNILLIITNMTLYLFDGTMWLNIIINDINLPGNNFASLKCPSIIELFNINKDYSKVLMVTGGFNFGVKSASKTVFVLNMKKSQCQLDFKYSDIKTRRYLHGSANIFNKYALIIGGRNEKDFLTSCEYLSFDKKEWNDFPQLPSPRANFSVGVMNSKVYLYGGYCSLGEFSDKTIEVCDINIEDISKSIWKSLTIKCNEPSLIPKLNISLIPYENNMIICGGTNGHQILDRIFEIEFDSMSNDIVKMTLLGKLKTPRSSYHSFMKDGEFYLVGGSWKTINFDDNKTHINNYTEKFTFDLNNNITSLFIPVASDDIIQPLIHLGLNIAEYKQEPGLPLSCSIITKSFH